jgi:hypothetical protein
MQINRQGKVLESFKAAQHAPNATWPNLNVPSLQKKKHMHWVLPVCKQ